MLVVFFSFLKLWFAVISFLILNIFIFVRNFVFVALSSFSPKGPQKLYKLQAHETLLDPPVNI